LTIELRNRGEAACRFLRIRAGLERLFLFAVVVFLVLVLGLLERHQLRVLRLGDLVRRVRVDEADDDVDQPPLAGLDRFVGAQQVFVRGREVRERGAHRIETFLDALGDADLALAGEELDRAHLAHVHAHRVGRATKLGIDGRERRGSLFDGLVVGRDRSVSQDQRFGVRRLLVHGNTHVVDHVDDIFDLFRIDDFARQVIVDFSVGEVALFLAARDQELQLGLTLVGDLGRCALWRFLDQGGPPRCAEDFKDKLSRREAD
jgi:hypothetical protein